MNFTFEFKVKLGEGMELRFFRIDYQTFDADTLALMIDPRDATVIKGSAEIVSSFSTIEIDLVGRGSINGSVGSFNVYRSGAPLFAEDVELKVSGKKFKYRNKEVNF